MTPVILLLKKKSIWYGLHELQSRTYDAATLAKALRVSQSRIIKTLILKTDTNEMVVALLPIDKTLDMKSLANLAGTRKVKMADPLEAQRSTGYKPGSISPLAHRHRLATYIDETVIEYCTIFVSGGRRGLELEIRSSDLIKVCDAIPGKFTR